MSSDLCSQMHDVLDVVHGCSSSVGPLHCHTVPLTSIQNGYQHVYFNNSATYDFMQPPSSLFIHVKVYESHKQASLPVGKKIG